MGEVTIHRIRYAYGEHNNLPNIDTDDQQKLSELLENGWQVHSQTVVNMGAVPSSSVFPEKATAYEAHLLLVRSEPAPAEE